MGVAPLAHDVFKYFPYGVLVFDSSGGLVAANKAASELLGPLRRTPQGHTPRCCDLFGCRTTGVLADACLAELAARTDKPMPEVRLDIGSARPVESVWATAAPLSNSGTHFIMEVRAAQASDRRRRTEPHWMGDARLRVFALGRTRVESREGPIEGSWLEQRAGQLFKYLICERHRVVYPDEIAAAIWPNEDAHATGTVRYFVHRLRRQLEPEPPENRPSSFVLAAAGGYRLAPSVLVDADDFERHAKAGLAAISNGRVGEATQQLEHAVSLYEGDLIADEPNSAWAFEERERLRGLAEQALRRLLQLDLERRDLDSSLARLRRLAELQPFDVAIHRHLLAMCIACGRRSEAMRRYSVLQTKLRAEFNEELDFEVTDLDPDDAVRALTASMSSRSVA